MNILITTFTYLPNKDGVSEACRVMAEGLAQLGWKVWVATSMEYEPSVNNDTLRQNEVNVVHFPLGCPPFNSPSAADEVVKFHQFVRDGKFDVVVNHCWDSCMARYLQVICASLSSRFVMVSHGYSRHIMDWQRSPFRGWRMWLRGMLFTFRTFPKMLSSHHDVVFLSEKKDFGRFLDHWIASATHHHGIHVIANAIDLGQFPSDDCDFRKRNGIGVSPMALCVANYSERKNQMLAVKTFREANVPGSVLVLIGSAFNDYAKLVQDYDMVLSREYQACRVVFLENLTRKETFAAYVACDLFLLTAKAETQPIVLIEAMAAGKPWISTDTGCVSEMAGGVVCRRRKQLPHTIRRLFRDESERHRLGALGKAEALANHDATKTAAKFDAILRGSIHSRR